MFGFSEQQVHSELASMSSKTSQRPEGISPLIPVFSQTNDLLRTDAADLLEDTDVQALSPLEASSGQNAGLSGGALLIDHGPGRDGTRGTEAC